MECVVVPRFSVASVAEVRAQPLTHGLRTVPWISVGICICLATNCLTVICVLFCPWITQGSEGETILFISQSPQWSPQCLWSTWKVSEWRSEWMNRNHHNKAEKKGWPFFVWFLFLFFAEFFERIIFSPKEKASEEKSISKQTHTKDQLLKPKIYSNLHFVSMWNETLILIVLLRTELYSSLLRDMSLAFTN